MDSHAMTLEDALQSLGWLPDWHGRGAEVIRVSAAGLRPGDLVVEAAPPDAGTQQLLTVRRAGTSPASDRAVAATARGTTVRSSPHALPRPVRLAEPPTRPTPTRSR
ncbi:hypothetical protein ACFVVA_13050 [Kitasatospora sp. NPDC058048]|uniref:hypothetical protein n=1 Tax=Kitasatospora sp. NPDC058048 TaxID=3346313 RepID=UPI0036D8521B